MKHTEGPSSILKSRFARGVFPLVAAFLACALAAPSARAAATTPPDKPVLIDTSASAGSVVASSSSSATFSADHAFDGNWADNAGRWLAYTNPDNDYGSGVHGETPMYLVYRFNVPTKVNVLRLLIQNANEWDKRSPKAWTFLGSHDGETWTTLDTRSGVAWASGTVTKSFSFENQTAYEYYKFSCTEILGENNYMQLYEIQFLYDAGIVLTDLTSPSGTVTTTTSGDWVKPAKNAFDNGTAHNNDDRSIHSGTTVDWIYTFDTPTKVDSYKVYAPGSGVSSSDKRMPKTWTFEAKNAVDANWTVLDTQSSETGWSVLESRYYEFENNTAYDSYRFAVTANNGGDNYIQIDELEFFYFNRSAPKLGNVSLARNGALAYSLSATEDMNAADISYILSDGATMTTNGLAAVAEGTTTNWTFSVQAENKTWQATVLATNASGTAEAVAGTLYTGKLTLGATTDANENGLVAGTVAVSRNSNDQFPLVVNYTISSSATGAAEGTTWAAPTAVTIPAGEKTGYLLVTPLLDSSITADITVTVTLAAGNYEIPAAASATLALVNLAAPSGYNVWIAPTNGLASVDSNWSAGHAPTSSENVLFDGRFSTADCEWDASASATVASWTQTNGYTGTVTVDTIFPDKGEFTVLTVTGDMTLSAGTITHKAHNSTNKEDFYRLRIDVGGDLMVASGAKIHATGKGAYGPRNGVGACAYGGSFDGNRSWGSLTEPYGVGSSPAADNTYNAPAGGAIWIEVAGDTTLDGSIRADSVSAWGQWNGYSGSGGAVYLKSKTLSGSGKISADCTNTSSGSNQQTGAGGRVSVLLTDGELGLSNDNLSALGGQSSYSRVGSVGTVLVRSPQKPNGVLYLRDRTNKYGMYAYRPKPNQLTRIPTNQTWVVDGIVFGANAILQVPTGTTLDLRGGLESISSTGNTLDETGLIVDGGTLLLPSAETHTISGKWIFEPKDFALDGNLVVTNGAGVGTLLLYSDTSNNVRTCGLSVSGDMHVASSAYLRAIRGGYIETGAATVGGGSTSCHGGQCGKSTANVAYDSFFHPRHPGTFGADNGRVNVGGGAIRLSVGGTLTLDGVASATPIVADARSGAPGSIDITAARLEGAGRIEANGNSRNYSDDDSGNSSGGGRVAVRLTGAGETFSDAWVSKINAKGYYTSKYSASRSSSAGSVYLQTADQAEGAGTIIIRNTGNTANDVAFTALPSLKAGGEEDNFRKASLKTEAAARVKLFDDLRMAKLEMEADTVLDLNGKKLVVNSAKVNGVKLASGTYTAESTVEIGEGTLADYLVDTAEGAGGSLVVTGGGFSVIVR